MSNERRLQLQAWSTQLGVVGLIGHIIVCLTLMLDTRPLGDASESRRADIFVKYGALVVTPVWVSYLRAYLRFTKPGDSAAKTIATSIAFVIITMSVIGVLTLFLNVTAAWAAGRDEILARAKYLLIFIGVCVATRLFSRPLLPWEWAGLAPGDERAPGLVLLRATRVLLPSSI